MPAELYVKIEGKYYRFRDLRQAHQKEILEDLNKRAIHSISGKDYTAAPRTKRKITASAYVFVEGKLCRTGS